MLVAFVDVHVLTTFIKCRQVIVDGLKFIISIFIVSLYFFRNSDVYKFCGNMIPDANSVYQC